MLPDGRLLSWSWDGTLRLWDVATGTALRTLEGHWGPVVGASVLLDGRLLSWSGDGTLQLWNGTTGASLATLEGHTDWVTGASVLPDGRFLSWSVDGTLRLWDGSTGALLATLAVATAAATHPSVFLAWRREVSPETVQGSCFAVGRSMNAKRRSMNAKSVEVGWPRSIGACIHWHFDGAWSACALLLDGTAIARCHKDLAFLQLHHGDRRVTLQEAEALYTMQGSQAGMGGSRES